MVVSGLDRNASISLSDLRRPRVGRYITNLTAENRFIETGEGYAYYALRGKALFVFL